MDLEGGGLELGQVVSRGHEDSEEQKFRGLGKAYSLRFGEERAGLGLGSATPLPTSFLTWVISGELTPAPSLAWSWRWAKGTPSGATLRSWALGPCTTPKCVRLQTGRCSTLRLLHRAAAEPRRGMERCRRNILGERRSNHQKLRAKQKTAMIPPGGWRVLS